MHPLLILAIGIATIIVLIVVLRVHAFLALVISALVVSALAPGELKDTVSRVAFEFGKSAGNIGIVIAMASIIGACMMESGAADRIVRFFLKLLGEKRAPVALMGSGYVLAMPVFFDTVFYLLVPLARSLYLRTKQNYLLYLVAIASGGAITHTLVPPTPGPLFIAAQFNVDLGLMIVMGMVVALPAAIAGLVWGAYINRKMPIAMREIPGAPVPEPLPDDRLPPLGLAILPVVLPVLLITANTVLKALTQDSENTDVAMVGILSFADVLGNANLALLLSAGVSILLYKMQRRPNLAEMTHLIETALMSGGVIILITAAGGAFGAMLKEAQVGQAIERLVQDGSVNGIMYLFLGFGIAAILKFAQGSSTVAMITSSGMLSAMLGTDLATMLGFHPVYLALACGAGSLIGSWMNDSGFWIFAKMGGLTEIEALKSWTPLLLVLGITSFITTTLLALALPMR